VGSRQERARLELLCDPLTRWLAGSAHLFAGAARRALVVAGERRACGSARTPAGPAGQPRQQRDERDSEHYQPHRSVVPDASSGSPLTAQVTVTVIAAVL
jgi:hypothetical protein